MNNTNEPIDVYERLATVLDAMPQGFPRMKSGVEIKLLKLVFTHEEVSLASYLTATYEYPADIAKRAGIAEEDAIRILGGLISRKLVRMKGPPSYPGVPAPPPGKDSLFRLGPFMIGWYEAVMRTEGKEFAELFHQYMVEGGGERILAPRPGVLGVVPVRGSLKPELMKTMEPHLDIDAHLQRHDRFLVMDCVCKKEMEALGKDDSRYPLKRCGFLGLPASVPLGEHVLSREEADQLLRKLERKGHVHNATYGFQMSAEKPQYVGGCNCDRHACGVFNNHYPSQASNYRSVIDPEKCVACGVCIDRCPVTAIAKDEQGKSKVERAKCIGCGVCVIGCNDEAIELVPVSKEEWFHTPSSMEEWEEMRLRNLAAEKNISGQ